VAVSIVLISVLLVVVCVLVLLAHGAVHMKQHWGAYRKGTYRLIARMDKFLDLLCKEFRIGKISDKHMKDAYASVLTKAEEFLWEVLNTVASGFSEGVSTSFIVFLYVIFWLLQPLPTGGKAGRLVRRYVFFKTLVSALYGGCVTALFFALGIDLAVLFGVVSFFLNFVPEVGAFISILVPIPVIVLDGRIQTPFLVLGMATLGQLILKFVFGTVLEVYLIEKDREMSIHPVWVILGLSYFGFVWGPTGMLISVPLLAMLKTALITAHSEMAEVSGPGQDNWKYICEALLVCLEGGHRAAEHGEGASKDGYGSIAEEKSPA
jgi:predicted PurR-regulated permease PerM